MPEVLGNPPSPRTALFWNGTAWQWALVDAAGHLQIDVLSTVMDAAAATAANQALILAQLQLIEDMRDALQSVATDRLIVRGEDQLFSFQIVMANTRSAAVSGAGGWVDSMPCAPGDIWHVTNVAAYDNTSPTTEHLVWLRHNGVNYVVGREVAAFAAWDASVYHGDFWLDEDDTVRVRFAGSLAGDICTVEVTGYVMTLET